jgi:sugar/nucleoside kinase (ribokinase family)
MVLVVGSVALDSVQTPFGTVTDALGGSATFFSVAASYFTDVGLVAVVGRDFPSEDIRMLENRGIDVTGLERLVRLRPQQPRDHRDEAERLRAVSTEAARRLPERRLRLPGEHRPGAAAGGAGAGRGPEVRRARHHELLD